MPRLFLHLTACLALPLAIPGTAFPADGTNLQARIDQAIEKGRKALLRRLDSVLKNVPGDYPVGRIAIQVAALLKAGISPEEPLIQAAFAKLETLKVEKTYCAACYLFALDGLWRARQKGDSDVVPLPLDGRRPEQREAAGDIQEKMAGLVRWLVEARIRGHGSWTYEPVPKEKETGPRAVRHDFSNTQFAVLGLQIGLEHGIDVPRDVFLETATLFAGSITREGAAEDVELTLETPLEAKLKLTRVNPARRLRSVPGGWGYTDPRRGKSKLDEPYASMSAAGASSLIIALKAVAGGKGAGGDAAKVLADGEKALHSAYAWIAKHFKLYLADANQLYYTLYSLEKVGDLGGLEKLGGHDWYSEGAARILDEQQPNGSWGSYVDTSLALLFLTRATRLLNAVAAPVILTGGRDDKPQSGAADLVYIDRARGFLSATALFKYMGETRRPEMVLVGEEVMRNYAPDSREDLVPHLLRLWSKEDRVTSFARKALAELTAVTSPQREAYVDWQAKLEAVKTLEARDKIIPDDVANELKRIENPRLKARLAGLAQRRGFRGLAALLVAELSVPSVEYRRRLHGILSLWTGEAVRPPASDTETAWEAAAKAWQEWWVAHGAEWEARRSP